MATCQDHRPGEAIDYGRWNTSSGRGVKVDCMTDSTLPATREQGGRVNDCSPELPTPHSDRRWLETKSLLLESLGDLNRQAVAVRIADNLHADR